MKINHKKAITASIAVVAAVALTLGGTFAWQSISQTALNEKEAVINPGGRLHDDFNGTNKDVYVENFADDTIYARVRLDEYFEIVMNKGTGVETKTVVTEGAEKDKTDTYITHKFDDDNTTDGYWNWETGGSTVYMPTFNKNKDSLKADINGTMDYTDAEDNAKPYGDYVEYTDGQEVTAYATYDNDSNNDDDDDVKTVEETHTAKETGTANLISMSAWLELAENGEETDNYWVYDTDGWVYWSSPISAGTATGLLLDEISLKGVMDDSYYYAINVVGQFITADDLGKDDDTGFYADGETVSDNALKLLKSIGVDVGDTTADDDIDDDLLEEGSVIYKAYIKNENYQSSSPVFDCVFLSSDNTVDGEYIAAVMNVNESDVYSVKVVEDLSSKEVKLPSSGAITDPNEYTASVKILNKVQPTNINGWFSYIGKRLSDTYEVTIDLTNLDTSKITDMSSMFLDAKVKLLNLSSFNTSNVSDMCAMFCGCDKLTELDLSSFDTSNVSNFENMFYECNSLKSLKIETFDTSSATNMRYMFYWCKSLPELNVKSFDTSKVTKMDGMFGSLRSITTLDVTNFDTSNVTDMSSMFANCDILEDLDLSNFNISKVTDMELMFYSCGNLTLDCFAWDVSNVTEHDKFNYDAPGVTEPTWVN